MASKWASASVLKAIFNFCFIVLFFQLLAFAEVVFASTMTVNSPLAHFLRYFEFLLAAQAIGLLLYFRLPWVAPILAWVSVLVILVRAVPWGTPAWRMVLLEFRFELIFLVLSHIALVVSVMKNRAEAEEIAEVTGTAAAAQEQSMAEDQPSMRPQG
ncbi:MAG TPA: hypothetical protein VGR47_09825 [Terracidiphilus sp.]|nr:hypothetical protein [Terracidiphilus sp.]